MKINCTSCRCEIYLKDSVVIDEINSIYHADCYGILENYGNQLEWKDFGKLKHILDKHKLN